MIDDACGERRARQLLCVQNFFSCLPPALCIYLLLCSSLSAQEQKAANVSAYPWSSIGKLNNSIGGSCTGAVIDRSRVLTAAHCIFNRRTAHFLPASALHFLLGYERGTYSVHALVQSYSIGRGYDPKNEEATMASDWCILRLVAPLPQSIKPLQPIDYMPESGTRLWMGSYGGRRRHVMTEDTNCRILGTANPSPLIIHDCASGLGSSGAPLLILNKNGAAAIAGIQVAIRRRDAINEMLAIPTAQISTNLFQ
jgi:protease YdgD